MDGGEPREPLLLTWIEDIKTRRSVKGEAVLVIARERVKE